MVNEFYVSGQIVRKGPLEQKKSGQSIAKVIITNEVNIQQKFEDNFLTIIFWGEMAKKLVNEIEASLSEPAIKFEQK